MSTSNGETQIQNGTVVVVVVLVMIVVVVVVVVIMMIATPTIMIKHKDKQNRCAASLCRKERIPLKQVDIHIGILQERTYPS